MYGSIGSPGESSFVILFSNVGRDGTKCLPHYLDFCLPVHRDGVLNGCHIKTTVQVRLVARFPEKNPADRFIRRCLAAIHNRFHYQDHDWVIRNHIHLLPWSDAVPLIKTR